MSDLVITSRQDILETCPHLYISAEPAMGNESVKLWWRTPNQSDPIITYERGSGLYLVLVQVYKSFISKDRHLNWNIMQIFEHQITTSISRMDFLIAPAINIKFISETVQEAVKIFDWQREDFS